MLATVLVTDDAVQAHTAATLIAEVTYQVIRDSDSDITALFVNHDVACPHAGRCGCLVVEVAGRDEDGSPTVRQRLRIGPGPTNVTAITPQAFWLVNQFNLAVQARNDRRWIEERHDRLRAAAAEAT